MAIGYATVKVNITAFVVDGIDSDDLPDDRPLTAKLVLTPMIAAGKTLQFNDDGVTKLKAVSALTVDIGASGDISHQGRDFVKVVAPTIESTNMARLQWRAEFKDIRLGGDLVSMQIDPIHFWVDPDVVVNIADHVNVAPSIALPLTRGPRGFGLVGVGSSEDGVVFTFESEDGPVDSDPIPVDVQASDATVASLVVADGSETKAQLDAAFAPVSIVAEVESKATPDQIAEAVSPKLDKTEAATTYAPRPLLLAATAGVYYTDQNGLVGDWAGGDANSGTGTNDTVAFQALLDSVPAGSTVMFNRFKRYRLDPVSIVGKSLTLEFNFCKVVTKTMDGVNFTTGQPFIKWVAPLSTVRRMPLSGAAVGSTAIGITPNSDAQFFNAGEYVIIRDDYRTLNWLDSELKSTTGRGEMNRVSSSVSGSPSVITLRYPLAHDYLDSQNNPTITKITTPVFDPVIRNIGLIIDTDPGGKYEGVYMEADGPHLFYFENCIRPVVSNVVAESWVGHIANFNRCLSPLMEHVKGYYPFYPTQGGHGYIGRMRHCNEGEFSHNVGYACRHVSNWAGCVRSVSHDCKSYESKGTAYQTHGLDSRDISSIDDTVIGGENTGWCFGNPEFNRDRNFTIIRPRYDGTQDAIAACSRSTGLRVIDPMIHTNKVGIRVGQGCSDVIVDIGNGFIEIRGDVAGTRAVWFGDFDASGVKPLGPVEVKGDNFQGPRAQVLVDLASGALTLDRVPHERVSVSAVGDVRVVQDRDAVNYGAAYAFPAMSPSGTAAPDAANRGYYARVVEGGGTVSKIGLQVAASSGNVSVAVYRGEGFGRNRKPTTRVATSGTVACPAVGYAEIALDSAVVVAPGDYLFFSCDNVTATFNVVSGQNSDIQKGRGGWLEAAAHPAPSVAGTMSASMFRMPLLVGLP